MTEAVGGEKPGSGKAVKRTCCFVSSMSTTLRVLTSPSWPQRLERAGSHANAKLVAEKQAAEAAAHRLQLEDFAESPCMLQAV